MIEQDNVILEGESFRKNEVFGFRELFLMQVRRVINNQSKEMRAGWWKKSLIASGQAEVTTAYIGDTRDEFINSVEALHDLSQPRFDEEMKKKSKGIKKIYAKERSKTKEEYDNAGEGSRGNVAEDWHKHRVELSREMFQALCFFAERKNWFEAGAGKE